MDLILWRHAEAEDGVPDWDRALTERGRKQAEKVAHWLQERLPQDALILASPAVRAQQTADALSRPYKTVRTIAPGANAVEILGAAGWTDANGTVLVVGHQPTLGQAVGLILCDEDKEFSLKKGGLIWLSNRTRGDQRTAVIKAAITPELV